MAKEKFNRTKPHLNIGTILKRESVVSQSTQHTLSMKQILVTMHTLTAQDMLTISKT